MGVQCPQPKENMATVLVGIPYHPNKRYCLTELYDWIDNQTYKDVEIILRVHLGKFGEPDAVKTQREFFRKIALSHNHDYFYSMGADTIPPLDVLERLLAHKRNVVGALYNQRKDTDKPNPIAWRKADPEKKFMQEDGLIKVDGMGMDAVLFSQKAFSNFSYMDWGSPDDDFPVYDHLNYSGFNIWLDKSIVCKHYISKDKFI
jgi:hypothetical protein